MNTPDNNASIAGYYQQINQLTQATSKTSKADQVLPVPRTPETVSNNFFTPFAMLFSLIIGLIAIYTAIKYKDYHRSVAMFGLSLLLAILPLGANLITKTTSFGSKANINHVPREVIIKEVTSTGFVIEWNTLVSSKGVIKLSMDPSMSKLVRSQTEAKATTQHQIQVNLLKPNTIYYFQLYSGLSWYDNSGIPLTIVTK